MARLHQGLAAALIALQFATAVSAAEVRVASRPELVEAIRRARAGDEIVIAPGAYQGGLSLPKLTGSKEQPIILRAADPANLPVFEGGIAGLQLTSPQHVELRDLVIRESRGNGLNIDDGGSPGSAHDVIVRNVVVEGVGPDGNRDGIKLSGLDRFRVENCQVRRWGSSGSAIDMVGCHDGEISGCRFEEARGDLANGVQAKGGSSDITIRRCRFENAGGSTGLAYFRPSDATWEARNITIEDCEFLGGQSAVAFVGVDGALVRHNTIYRPGRWVFRILQENTDDRFIHCRNGRFVSNIVMFRSSELSTAVNVGGKTKPESFEIRGNLWRCIDRPQDTRRLVRLPVGETAGEYDRDPQLANPEQGDLTRKDRKPDDAGVRTP
ncbi:MAG TPA: right-handed parallel beta-helix repeat-containing protein [Caulifigura sp.]|nr:right-handed parallel beta-helix repeat-containing protein [Caulifigura sp.]